MADYRKYEEIKVDREDRLLTITLDSPEARNALGGNKHQELEAIWQDIAADDSVGAVILTGSGDRVFSAGGDVKRMGERAAAPAVRSFVGPKRIIANMRQVEQPSIAAINGHADGVGASLAFA